MQYVLHEIANKRSLILANNGAIDYLNEMLILFVANNFPLSLIIILCTNTACKRGAKI